MGYCEDRKYFILGNCNEGEEGCEADCFESYYDED